MHVQVGDVRLFFDVEGPGLVPDGPQLRERPTLLLLHGGPGLDHSAFRPRMSALAHGAQVIYLDQRGNGRSERSTPERWTLETWADDVRGFCEVLGIRRPVVLGTSFGAWVALAYAARYPEHPAGLVLMGGSARFRLERTLERFVQLGGARAADVARRFFAEPLHHYREYLEVCFPLYARSSSPGAAAQALSRTVMNPEVGAHFIAGELQTFDLHPELPRVACPVLLLAGTHDPIATPADAEELAAALPPERLRVETLPGAGHFALSDAPDRALAAIRAFLGEVGGVEPVRGGRAG